MKHLLTCTFLLIASFAGAQIVNIPDANLKNELLMYAPAIDLNGNGEIEVAEALQVQELSFPGYEYNNYEGIGAFKNLRRLYWVGGASNATMDLRGCDSLRYLGISSGTFASVNVSGLTKLDSVMCFTAPTSIHDFSATNCPSLTTIYGDEFSFVDNFDVAGCVNLKRIYTFGFNTPVLDFSTCPNLEYVVMRYSTGPNVRYVNVKNGSYTILSMTEWYNWPSSDICICADDIELDSLRNRYDFTFPNGSGFQVNSYCSFYPGGNYNTIQGNLKLDLNSNGCDVNDGGMPNVPVVFTDTASQSIYNYTNSSGDYSAYTNRGLFTVTPYFPYPYFTVNPSSATIVFDTANNIVNTTDFCISATGVHNDLSVVLLPTSGTRPGFSARYSLTYRNRGTTVLSGSAQVNYDNSKMNLTYSSVAPSSQPAGQLIWNFTDLRPFESRTINIHLTLLPSPVNNIGDTLTYMAVVNPVAGDETPSDNTFILPQRVTGAYDPNEKICVEGDKLDITRIGDKLHYVIHFQNVGTDTAFNVVVADTLSNKLDWNTFDFISGSHNCHIKRIVNKLEFYFENINLPYKAINDVGSNGFVAFEIKPKGTVMEGDSLNNKAAIYFDFNPPVITNMVTTIITTAAGPVPVKLEYFSATARGAKNVINWKAACSDASVTFNVERGEDATHFKALGTITASNTRCLMPFDFNDNEPLAGKNYYRLKLIDINGISFYSKIVVVGNNRSGVEILTVANNTVYINADKQQNLQLKVIATDGKILFTGNKMITAGANQFGLPIKNISTGIYILVIYTGEGEIITKRFVK